MASIRLKNWFFQVTANISSVGTRFLTNDKPTQSTFEDLIESKVNKWTTDPEDNSTLHDYATKSDIKTGTNKLKVVSPNNIPRFLNTYTNNTLTYTPDSTVLANSDVAFTIPASNVNLVDSDAVANTESKLVVGASLSAAFIASMIKIFYMVKNLWYPVKSDYADVVYEYRVNGIGSDLNTGSTLTYNSLKKGNVTNYWCIFSNTFTEATSSNHVIVTVSLPITHYQVLGLYGGSYLLVHFPCTAETGVATGLSCTSLATISENANTIIFTITVPRTYIKAVRDASLSGYEFKGMFSFDILTTA